MKIVVFLFALTGTFLAATEKNEPLPDHSDVKSISVEFNKIGFKGSTELWQSIRKTLVPAKIDAKPSKWEWLASIKVNKKDGSSFIVELYNSKQEKAAFAAGKTYKERIYYRGGKNNELINLLRKAHLKSTKQ